MPSNVRFKANDHCVTVDASILSIPLDAIPNEITTRKDRFQQSKLV